MRPAKTRLSPMPMAVFHNFFRLAAPYRRQIQLAVPSGEPIAICFKVL